MGKTRETKWGRCGALEGWLVANNVTAKALAREVGVTAAALHYIISGDSLPRPELAWKLAEVTGLTLEQLYARARSEGKPDTRTPLEVGSNGDHAEVTQP